MDIREIVRRTREEQGLPPTVEDSAALDMIAGIVKGWQYGDEAAADGMGPDRGVQPARKVRRPRDDQQRAGGGADSVEPPIAGGH